MDSTLSLNFPLELRIWIEREKKMIYQEDQYLISFLRRSYLFHSGGQHQHPGYGEPPFMFWTGLIDKNKKKIFTEDFVVIKRIEPERFYFHPYNQILEKPHKVFWDGCLFAIVDDLKTNGEDTLCLYSFVNSDKYEVEVVGNTFENPDGIFVCSECQFEEARHSLECSKKSI